MLHKYFQKVQSQLRSCRNILNWWNFTEFYEFHVEFYGYICTSSAEADWRKRDLMLQGFLLWIKSMAWPEHLHTQECLMKGPSFCSPDAFRLQARQAAGRGRSCLKKSVPWCELTDSCRCTCTPTGINFVVRNRHKSWGYAQHFSWPISSVKGCTELFFQKHDILKPSLKARAMLLLILALLWNAHLSLSIILSAYFLCLGFLRIQFCTLVLRCAGFHIGIERKINWKKNSHILVKLLYHYYIYCFIII